MHFIKLKGEFSTATLLAGNKYFMGRVICQTKGFPFLLFPFVIIIKSENTEFVKKQMLPK